MTKTGTPHKTRSACVSNRINRRASWVPGNIALGVLRSEGSIAVEERTVTREEVFDADEIWISSSSKELAPVTHIDGQLVGDGKPGPVWEKAAKLYSAGKFNY